jgi:N-acetylglucosamine-6-sulfatase
LILGQKAPHGPFVPEEKYAHTYDAVAVPYPRSGFALASKPRWVTARLDTWHGIYGPLYGFREKHPDRSKAAVADFERFVRSYTGTINSVDDSVGAIYAALAEQGVLDDTIFVFSSDNGFLLGEHGMIDKRSMHEESIRVPLVVRYPRRAKPGSVIREQVLSVDLAPSLLELTGAQPLPKTHGASWAPLLAGKTEGWRKSWYYAYDYEKQFPYTPNVRGVRTDGWKYVRYPHGDGGADRHKAELYDLAIDPGERHNLAGSPAHASRVLQLRAELDRLMREAGALPDRMPIDEGIKSELPEESIR